MPAGRGEQAFEMQSGVNRSRSTMATGRDLNGSGFPQRSTSTTVDRRPRPRGPISSNSYPPPVTSPQPQANHETSMPSRSPSKRVGEGIKRRIGSILRKKPIEAAS